MEKEMSLRNAFSIYEKILKTKFDSRSQNPMDEYDIRSNKANVEFEVRFKNIKKLEFERVYNYLILKGFIQKQEQYQLKISHTVNGDNSDESKIRCQINDLSEIKEFCKKNVLPESTEYLFKQRFMREYPKYYDNDDFGFRVSIQKEYLLSSMDPAVVDINSQWKNIDKMFRYMNRVSLIHPDFPSIVVDFSTVKSIKKDGQLVKERMFSSSQLFQEEEEYELEIELVDLEFIHSHYNDVFTYLTKTIKFVSCGIQDSHFPIPLSEQLQISSEYKKLITKPGEVKELRVQQLLPNDLFIGPSSYTLQKINLINDASNKEPCILNDFSVTDKADGDRKMCYISLNGKIYFITNNMEIQYTGVKCQEPDLFNSLIDGEFIREDKMHKRIDLFAAFDIYFRKGKELRHLPFINDTEINRYNLLDNLLSNLNIKHETVNDNITFVKKIFYTPDESKNIMECCYELFKHIENNTNYNTDGLIFTSNSLGVGLEPGKNEKANLKNSRKTWSYSFKWKPPEYNTIDFLVKIKKVKQTDEISYIISSDKQTCISYKCLNLYVGYDEKKHGLIHPQKMLMEEFDLQPMKEGVPGDDYKPVLFSPTNPIDNSAHICCLPIVDDSKIMTKENEVIESDMVVEFAYEFNDDKRLRWIPLRVRYDKTAEYRKYHKRFGNDYKVANSNWFTIHNPITKEMITNKDLKVTMDDVEIKDIYYNRNSGIIYTNNLRKFHNQKIKKLLFDSTINEHKDCLLIDYAIGKGGDLNKLISLKPKFVFGIDISRDNIHNSKDGVCARYIGLKRQNNSIYNGLFIRGDSSKFIMNGDFSKVDEEDDDEKISRGVIEQVFGLREKTNHFGNYVGKLHGIGRKLFDVGSIQFALHYMFKDEVSVHSFMKNLSDTIKVGGTFIGTCYDGSKIFNMLNKLDQSQSVDIFNKNNTTKIWSITKKYLADSFPNNEESLGLTISVYQDSINQEIEEYLVNFNYFSQCMMLYGFEEEQFIPGTNNALPGCGDFKLIYDHYGGDSRFGKDALTEDEKKISFLNRYFIYRKVRTVNTDMVFNKIINKEEDQPYLNKISRPIKLNKQIVLTM